MKLIGYVVDLSFANTPSVHARVAIPDPATGEEKTETMHFVDDDARELVTMVPNPKGVGLVNHPDGLIDGTKLRAKLDERVSEMRGGTAAATLAARIAAAEDARRTAHAAKVAAAAAQAAKDASWVEKEALDADIERAKATKAQLDAEIAAKRAEAAKA